MVVTASRLFGLVSPVKAEAYSLQPEIGVLKGEFRQGISDQCATIELGSVYPSIDLVASEADA